MEAAHDLDSAPTQDLGPLAWVLDELRKSLDSASSALRRFVRDAAAARGEDMASVDAGQLRIARQHMHQAVGALEMVGLPAPAHMLRAMEGAVQKFVERPELCNETAAAKVERAGFALTEYLEALLLGKNVSPVSLFVQYRDVQELTGSDRIHPADLWVLDWRWLEPQTPPAAEPLAYHPAVRTRMDQAVLRIVKSGDPAAGRELADVSLRLAAGQQARQPRAFWKIAAGYFEAVGAGLLPADVYVKRAASRVLLQYASLAKGEQGVSDRLAQDLVFFCGQAQPVRPTDAPLLSAVRHAYGLTRNKPVDYSVSPFGKFDPALLSQARKRVAAAKETWSALSGGDTHKLKAMGEQAHLVAETLGKLHPPSAPLGQALTHAIDGVVRSGKPPSTELAMEVATAILYLEAAFQDLDPNTSTLGERTKRLAERLNKVAQGGQQEPLEHWVEELYRRVSDRQTMGSVVGELRGTLSELEKLLDQFFRNPEDKTPLRDAPGFLAQMRGVLSVLGLDHASQAVQRMRDTIEQIIVDQVDEASARAAGTFDKLGNSLGALGFLIDMLNYQPTLAKKLFVYDEATGELRPLMGRAEEAAAEEQEPQDEPAPPVQAAAVAAPVAPAMPEAGAPVAEVPAEPPAAAPVAAPVAAPAQPVAAGLPAIEPPAAPVQAVAAAVAVPVPAAAAPVAAPVAAAPAAQEDDGDDELLEIFLEEAREVVGNGLAAIQALAAEPSNVPELTTLRRAFHTLKGSSRMVGLTEFGEAAWAMEQVLNTWLADQKHANDDLRKLSTQALEAFGQWVDDIANKADRGWKAGMFRGPADSLRTQGKLVPLELPQAGPAPVAEVAPALEAAPAAPVEAAQPPASAAPALDLQAFDLPSLDLPGAPAQPAAEDSAPGQPAPQALAIEPQAPAAEPPVAAAAPAAPALAAFDFSLELPAEPAPAAEASAPAPEAFAFDLELPAEPAVQPPVEAPAAEVTELAPEDLPPEFEAFTRTAIMPRAEVADEPAPPEVAPLDIAGIDFTSLAAVAGPAAAPAQPAEPQPVAEPQAAADFGVDLEPAASEAVAEPAAQAPAARATESAFDFTAQPPSEVLDASLAEVPLDAIPEFAAALAEAAPELPAEPVTEAGPVADIPAEPVSEALTEPVIEAAAEPVAELSPVEAAQPAEAAEPAADAAVRDEQVKVIGHLRIGIPLYNVYLNEADEWSRRLVQEVGEWTLEMNQRLPDSTVGWAHALAGSSATVGFQALSDVARALEHALQQTQSLAHGTPQHAQAFTQAAEEVRRLLHQFAAGFLKEPDPAVVEALEALKDLDLPLREQPESQFSDSEIDDAELAPPAAAAAPAEPVRVAPVPAQPPQAAAAPAAQVRTVEVRGDDEDDLDVVDAIDPDLFPIFEEEGAELMPVVGSALRQWAAHPGQREPRDQLLRALHTLKGSARLAGALRLGEQAHRLESEVEYLGTENVNPADIEALLQRFDAMQARFDTLRATGGEAPPPAQAEAAPAPAAPAAPVASGEPAANVAHQADSRPAAQAAPARAALALPAATQLSVTRQAANQAVRVRSQLLDRLMNQAGEVMITRSRLENELKQLRGSLADLTGNLDRLRTQLRDIELQAETQMQSRLAQAKDSAVGFDPLEFDRFTRVQELTRMMAESVNDVATVQRNIQRVVEATEDDLIAQARQTRELQRDLLRTRMVEFEGISDRLYRVVRLAAKESSKQVKLDIVGGSIEMDRGVLDRMTPAFEHLLRNCVAHGIEAPAQRAAAGKDATGTVTISVQQEGNDVSVEFHDDGAGLNLEKIREKAVARGLIKPDQQITPQEAGQLIFLPGFSTATEVTELAGRGIGMDVVRSEVNALGGRIETDTVPGRGSSFKLVLPLTTAVTQVVMVRSGKLAVGVPASLVELVRRASVKEVQQAYNSGRFEFDGEQLPFFWSGALLQSSARSNEPQGKTLPVVIFRSAAQRVAVHVDEVLGNQEVVVKNLGPQLSRLPGLAGMTVLASGAVVLIYNPVALAQVYGNQARAMSADQAQPEMLEQTAAAEAGRAAPVQPLAPVVPQVPLVLVVDDSITVRRVTQRLLQREGYRVALAADGLQALERLAEELPAVVLSDIEMPRMDGFDLARNIRGDERLRGLPIVMITSRIAEKHREHAMELGVNHYLGKPYSEEELLSLVRHYAQLQQQQAVPA